MKIISADIKTDVKQEIKTLVAVSYNFMEVPSQNLKHNVKQACIFSFSFNLGWYSMQPYIIH